jgi:8-oxo-dGTP pyrophosphatase MutT (NUDIX family)
VFPGGSVDAADGDPDIGWAGPSPADVADRLSTSPERARALVCAAVRETFEESGVLLAGPSPAALVDDSAALARDRRALLTGTTSFGELLGRLGLMLRADLLTPWARWVTPEASPRRFDTWFFAAALPPGQTAALEAPAERQDQSKPHHGEPHHGLPHHGESDQGTWLRSAGALESARTGEITLLPPTAVTLGELAHYDSVTAVLAQRRTMTMRMPRVMIDGNQAWLALPPPETPPGQPQGSQP